MTIDGAQSETLANTLHGLGATMLHGLGATMLRGLGATRQLQALMRTRLQASGPDAHLIASNRP